MAEFRILSKIQDNIEQVDFQKLRKQLSEDTSSDQKMQKRQKSQAANRYEQLLMEKCTCDTATGSSHKLFPKHKGPFRITPLLQSDYYEVESLREDLKRTRTVIATAHFKPWITFQDDLGYDNIYIKKLNRNFF